MKYFSKIKIQMNNKQPLFLESFCHLFCPMTIEMRYKVDAPFVAEQSTNTYYLHFYHL